MDFGISPVHGAAKLVALNPASAEPLEKVGLPTVDSRSDEVGGFQHTNLTRRLADRSHQRYGRFKTNCLPDILQVLAKEIIKYLEVLSLMIFTVPPTPVRTLGNVNFLPGQFRLCLIEVRVTIQKINQLIAGCAQEIPSRVVFLVAYPDAKIVIDPGTGKKERQRFDGLFAGEDIRRQHGFNALILIETSIKCAQEIGSVVGVILPGVLAVENHRHHSINAGLFVNRSQFMQFT